MLQNHWKLTTIKFLFKDFVSSLNSSFVINTAQDDKHVEGGLKLEKTGQPFIVMYSKNAHSALLHGLLTRSAKCLQVL